MSMNEWNAAKSALAEAQAYVGKIGKDQHTTSRAIGKWHSIGVATQAHYQPTDGAKNYHECKVFDAALSAVLQTHMADLQAEAIDLLKAEVEITGKAARHSVQTMLDQINEYETS